MAEQSVNVCDGSGENSGTPHPVGDIEMKEPEEDLIEIGYVSHKCESNIVCRGSIDKIPYFNAEIYTKEQKIGIVGDIFGKVDDHGFLIILGPGLRASLFERNQKVFANRLRLLSYDTIDPTLARTAEQEAEIVLPQGQRNSRNRSRKRKGGRGSSRRGDSRFRRTDRIDGEYRRAAVGRSVRGRFRGAVWSRTEFRRTDPTGSEYGWGFYSGGSSGRGHRGTYSGWLREITHRTRPYRGHNPSAQGFRR
ncbi:unnamed protein product [Dracunculus medinensis]|uniref:H/ACA ribonucleoprotein complex subunit n=1 Tax=Dracunculus medinensis TaxID=318479 RepID=A0A0N4U8B4_DRAME|nr:unnamed protein product [Dracunculus medinensis]